jgi:hypothetical protein
MSSTDDHVTAETPAEPQAAEGRDSRGRFAKGNKGGPGNPFARKVAALRQAFVSFVSEDDLKHIVFVIKMRAEGGDMAAAKLLLQYALGKPAEAMDPDRVDADEWEKLQEHARPHEEMAAIMNGVPAGLAATLTKLSWDCAVEQRLRAPLRMGLQGMAARDAARQASAEQQRDKRAARRKRKKRGGGPAPMANGGNGPLPEAWPSVNGGNGELDPGDWLQALVREVMDRSPGGNGAERR